MDWTMTGAYSRNGPEHGDQPPACVHCKWFVSQSRVPGGTDICLHEGSLRQYDVVSGYFPQGFARASRKDENRCGKAGRYFEQKPEYLVPPEEDNSGCAILFLLALVLISGLGIWAVACA